MTPGLSGDRETGMFLSAGGEGVAGPQCSVSWSLEAEVRMVAGPGLRPLPRSSPPAEDHAPAVRPGKQGWGGGDFHGPSHTPQCGVGEE